MGIRKDFVTLWALMKTKEVKLSELPEEVTKEGLKVYGDETPHYNLSSRLSTLQPQIAMKNSSARSSSKHNLSSSLPTLSRGSSSLLISESSSSANLSVNDTFSKTILILSLSITSTKIGKYPKMSKHFKYLQDSPGYVNVNSQVTFV